MADLRIGGQMKNGWKWLAFAVTAVGAVAALSGVAKAQYSENEQTVACMGDAFRLCSGEIPDKQRIIACLASKHSQLSSGCVGVFDANMRALQRGAH